MIKGNTRDPSEEIDSEYYREQFYQYDLDRFEGVPYYLHGITDEFNNLSSLIEVIGESVMKCPNCGREMKSKIRDYEYVESGLKDVVLRNIKVYECPSCGELLPEVANVKQIHKWIAEYLLRKQSPLTGEEFRFLRKEMRKL